MHTKTVKCIFKMICASELPNVSFWECCSVFPRGPRFITQVPVGQGAVFGRRSVDHSLRGSVPPVVRSVWFRIKCTELWQHEGSKPTQGCPDAQPNIDSHNIIIHLQYTSPCIWPLTKTFPQKWKPFHHSLRLTPGEFKPSPFVLHSRKRFGSTRACVNAVRIFIFGRLIALRLTACLCTQGLLLPTVGGEENVKEKEIVKAQPAK